VELQGEVKVVVEQTKQRSHWPVRRTLLALEIPPASYYRWCCSLASVGASRSAPRPPVRGSMYEVLESERRVIIEYALKHPEVRHRELAWKMVDEGVCAVSSSTVYRVLREAGLVCAWKPGEKRKSTGRPAPPTKADELWQTDIRYTKVREKNYYLLSFIDVYSRYIVYHELLRFMDGWSVSTAAATALETLPAGVRPTIQSDHGSGFIAKEFAGTLAERGVGHTLIRPHTPTDNGIIERCQRTIGELIEEHELEDFTQAQGVIAEIIRHYNHERLHSSLSYLRPVDYYRGNPEALLARRRRKLQEARELRKQENLKLRQRLIPWTETENVA
jgi:putative transposase